MGAIALPSFASPANTYADEKNKKVAPKPQPRKETPAPRVNPPAPKQKPPAKTPPKTEVKPQPKVQPQPKTEPKAPPAKRVDQPKQAPKVEPRPQPRKDNPAPKQNPPAKPLPKTEVKPQPKQDRQPKAPPKAQPPIKREDPKASNPRREQPGIEQPRRAPTQPRRDRNNRPAIEPRGDHRQHIDEANFRSNRFKDDRRIREHVERQQHHFHQTCYQPIVQRRVVYETYYSTYHRLYRPYRHHGFYGGFYYGFNPIVNISVHFDNPLVAWFYTDDSDDYYYRHWCGNTVIVDRPYRVFRYRRVYYPTVEFRDLVVGVSAMPITAQANFQDGMQVLSEKLAQILADRTQASVSLSSNDIVVNSYQLLRDRAVVVEGYVDSNNIRFAFKGLVDLTVSENTGVFVPANYEGEPTNFELEQLQAMNLRILDLGGRILPED